MDIESWGPKYWQFLHTTSFVYPEEPSKSKRQAMFEFMYAFGDMIPCLKCSTHFRKMLERDLQSYKSQHLESRDALSRFICDMHNEVNRRLSKPEMLYTDVCELYVKAAGVAPSVCAMRSMPATQEEVVADAVVKRNIGRWHLTTHLHDFTLLIGCAAGVLTVCIVMICVGVLTRRKAKK